MEKYTPGEIATAANYRTSVVDPRKSLEELSFPELFLLQTNSEELDRYNRDRAKYLLEKNGHLLSSEPSFSELLEERFGPME